MKEHICPCCNCRFLKEPGKAAVIIEDGSKVAKNVSMAEWPDDYSLIDQFLCRIGLHKFQAWRPNNSSESIYHFCKRCNFYERRRV